MVSMYTHILIASPGCGKIILKSESLKQTNFNLNEKGLAASGAPHCDRFLRELKFNVVALVRVHDAQAVSVPLWHMYSENQSDSVRHSLSVLSLTMLSSATCV